MCWMDEEEYLRRRVKECRQSADNAEDKGVRKVHEAFARRYEEAAEEQQHQPAEQIRQKATVGG